VRWRPLHLAILLFQFFWLNVIVPGHRRGMVQMPGSPAACPCCCCDAPITKSPNSKSQAPAGNPGNCAICNFMAHLTLPAPIDFSLAPLRFLHHISPERAVSLAARRVLLPFDGRGPPIAA
jgi:hypothetical protein